MCTKLGIGTSLKLVIIVSFIATVAPRHKPKHLDGSIVGSNIAKVLGRQLQTVNVDDASGSKFQKLVRLEELADILDSVAIVLKEVDTGVPDNSRSYPVKHLRFRRSDDVGKDGGGGLKVGVLGTGEKNNGSIANARSQKGKAAATAMSKTGDAQATALNGSQATAMALSAHENGDAKATADTHGEGGSKANSMASGKGNATASGISRGTGDSQASAIAAKGGSARADSDAREGGNSTANSIAVGKGEATSDSLSRKGSSSAAAITKGTGDSKSNSVAGGENGSSKSLAMSQGGNVIANSRTLQNGSSHAIGSTKGDGTSIANSISKGGNSQADSVAQNGAAVANAMSGIEGGESEYARIGMAMLDSDEDDATDNARRRRGVLSNIRSKRIWFK